MYQLFEDRLILSAAVTGTHADLFGELITCIIENRVSIQQVFFDYNKVNPLFETILSAMTL